MFVFYYRYVIMYAYFIDISQGSVETYLFSSISECWAVIKNDVRKIDALDQ